MFYHILYAFFCVCVCVQVMKSLHHAHLVSLLAVCTVGEPVLIISELMSNGNLLDYLRDFQEHLVLEVWLNQFIVFRLTATLRRFN